MGDLKKKKNEDDDEFFKNLDYNLYKGKREEEEKTIK